MVNWVEHLFDTKILLQNICLIQGFNHFHDMRMGFPHSSLKHICHLILTHYRVWFNDFWFVFQDSGRSFHEPYFIRKLIFHESYTVNGIYDYGVKTCK